MRLLIIEDEVEIANLLSRYLAQQGFTVSHAKDGDAGLAAFVKAVADGVPFDVVLTDGLLPKKNGYELCQEIRRHPAGAATGLVLMSAAFRGAKARSDAYHAGIDAYFTKPFVLTELKEKLKELATKQKTAPAHPPKKTTTTTTTTPATTMPAKPKKLESQTLTQPSSVAATLLQAARSRFEGVLRFVDGESALQIAFLRGVVVGAGDNLREHALGEWLRRQGRLSDAQARALDERIAATRERVAEALLSLGFVTATEALTLVELQAEARLRRALLWRGRVDVVEGEDAAAGLASHTIDVVDVLLRFALEPGREQEARAFVDARAAEVLERTADFDAGLVAFARLRPSSTLPQLLLERVPTVAEAQSKTSALEVHALWFAGLLRAAGDPPLDSRAVPRALKKSESLGGAVVDKDAVARVASTLLKARGVTVYRLLGVPPTTPTGEVLQRLRGLVADVGRDALADVKLGPATSAARELWTLLDEHVFVFSDERRRQSYDADWSVTATTTTPLPPTSTLLEAQLLTAAGAVTEAAALVEDYAAAHPDDVEGSALRGHLCVLRGERQKGVALLVEAARRHPQSTRPVYYLALLALADGDTARAAQMLNECERRSPGDADVQRALRLL